jgi:hypothetical protein
MILREGEKMTTMSELNEALKVAVADAEGDPEMFALLLTAPLASWMLRGMIDSHIAAEAIRLLHKLHPNVTV